MELNLSDINFFFQLSGVLDVMLSHDWPKGVYNYGSKDELLKNKPFFRYV